MVPATDDRAEEPRLARVVAILRETPGISYARPLAPGKLVELLRPWLGSATDDPALPLPAVVEVRLAGEGPELSPLTKQLEEAAPGTLLESHGVWVQRLSALARSVQTCAFLALGVVAAVSGLVVAVATRAGLAARRESIEIVHGLGATDGYIASRFARRATMLAAIGGAAGALTALPVLLSLARLAAPFTAGFEGPSGPSQWGWLATLPAGLWLALPALPAVAAAIGFITAQATVRRWLRRLP
jgi:cell division transport system permease protein